jgi:hypothetical protein
VVKPSLEREVRRRAGGACEYCRFPESAHAYPFHIEHVISRQNHGTTTLDNLALACNMCNLHKGPNVAGIDRTTGKLFRLFNPRADAWPEHFQRRGAELRGLTPMGRVTVHMLGMNEPARLATRRAAIAAGLLPQGDPPTP